MRGFQLPTRLNRMDLPQPRGVFDLRPGSLNGISVGGATELRRRRRSATRIHRLERTKKAAHRGNHK